MKKLVIECAVAMMLLCSMDSSDAWIFSRNNDAMKGVFEESWDNPKKSFKKLESSLKNLKKLAQTLRDAYLSDAKKKFNSVSLFGTSGKEEFNALIDYLDNAAKAAKDIYQFERDDVQVEKVLKVTNSISAVAACDLALSVREKIRRSELKYDAAKFNAAFDAFERCLTNLDVPQQRVTDINNPVVGYSVDFVEGLLRLKTKLAAPPKVDLAPRSSKKAKVVPQP